MITKEEFTTKFRGKLLLLLTEAWACRNEHRDAQASVVDEHYLRCRQMLAEMYDALNPPLKPEPPRSNGTAPAPLRKG